MTSRSKKTPTLDKHEGTLLVDYSSITHQLVQENLGL